MQYKHPIYTKYGCDLDGTTYSTKGKRRKVTNSTTGYEVLGVRLDSETVQYRAHRFIYECVTGELIPSGMVINHIDGCKTNNSFSNLELVTASENTIHAFKIGLIKPLVGELNGCSRITSETVRSIIRDIINNLSNKELANKYLLDLKHISLIRNKKRWKFIFEEEEFKEYSPIKITQRKLDSVDRVEYLKDLNSTMTNSEIAKKYKLDASTVSRRRLKERSTTIEHQLD